MAAHNRSILVSAKAGGGWLIEVSPRSIFHERAAFRPAVRVAERLAAEYHARILIDLEPVGGDYGPRHLVNGATVYRARDCDGYAVAILNRPLDLFLDGCEFVGPNADKASKGYADKLVALIASKARDEQARRTRIKELSRSKVRIGGDV